MEVFGQLHFQADLFGAKSRGVWSTPLPSRFIRGKVEVFGPLHFQADLFGVKSRPLVNSNSKPIYSGQRCPRDPSELAPPSRVFQVRSLVAVWRAGTHQSVDMGWRAEIRSAPCPHRLYAPAGTDSGGKADEA